jgi:hypothetical protein
MSLRLPLVWTFILLTAPGARDLSAASSDCDRACLIKTLDSFLAAVLKHDPSRAPLDAGFRYTENASVVPAGEGLWKTATAVGKVQRRYADPVTGQAVYFGHVEEGGAVGIATLRVRVIDRKITEGELVIGRKSDGMFNADGLSANAPPLAPIAKSARSSREAMVRAAQSYFDGLERHDSSEVLGEKGCVRIENGVMTAGPVPASNSAAPAQSSSALPPASGPPVIGDCASRMDIFKATIARVDHRRFPVVDERAGVVLGMVVFNRPPGAKRGDGTPFPRNLLTEIFVVEHGRIRGIYAAMHYLVPDNPEAPGWR